MVGVSLLASAVVFGAIAGGVVVHRLESTPTLPQTLQEHSNNSDDSGDGQAKHKPVVHPAHPSPEPDDAQDKEA
jgi:hypothetical protein